MTNNFSLSSNAARLAKLLAAILALCALVVWADPPYLECSDVDLDYCNTCNDSCSPATLCGEFFGPCSGYVYDYTGMGGLSCVKLDKHCGPDHEGQSGTNCRETSYQVMRYGYVNAYPNGGCPPCIRSYYYLDMVAIADVITQENIDCVPIRPF